MTKPMTAGLALLLMSVGAAGCDVVDRIRRGDTADAAGVSLNLESPGMVRPGEEAAIRLGISNRADTAVSAVRVDLMLPAWMEPLPPEPAGTEVTMVASGEGTRLSYRAGEPPLQAGESRTIVQRVRIPRGEVAGAEISPSRTVRAWLVGPDGEPLGGEVASDLVVDTAYAAAPADTAAADTAGRDEPMVESEAVGDLRLGMTPDQVRNAFPGTRDTSWTAEGMTERGLLVPAGRRAGTAATAPLVALVADGRVARIHVRDGAHRTAEGAGVGTTLEELRAAYGTACGDVGERGEAVVWFARKPGVSFVLDLREPDPNLLRNDPGSLPGTARVRELFVRRGAAGC